jgi:threonine aldolase
MGLNVAEPETNILLVPVLNIPLALSLTEGVGVRVLPVGSALRFITHRDLKADDIDEALVRMQPLVAQLLTTWEGDRPMV